jgi:serine/threonine protein kinase
MSAPDGGPVRLGDRYSIEDCIGVGAMGAVWRATDELLGRTVAVKELLAVPAGTSAADVEQSRQRILREGRIGARLQHAHLISMFDVVVHEDRPWLVMEYLPSESLAARLRLHGPLPLTEVADIGRQMADGLLSVDAQARPSAAQARDLRPRPRRRPHLSRPRVVSRRACLSGLLRFQRSLRRRPPPQPQVPIR